jgi:hypothetical protein
MLTESCSAGRRTQWNRVLSSHNASAIYKSEALITRLPIWPFTVMSTQFFYLVAERRPRDRLQHDLINRGLTSRHRFLQHQIFPPLLNHATSLATSPQSGVDLGYSASATIPSLALITLLEAWTAALATFLHMLRTPPSHCHSFSSSSICCEVAALESAPRRVHSFLCLY